MALDTTSEENFDTGNFEEAVRLIENLASSNSTKNTAIERKKLADTWIRSRWLKLNQSWTVFVNFSGNMLAEDVKTVDTEGDRGEEEDVN